MYSIAGTLPEFKKALLNNEKPVCTPEGTWYRENWFYRSVRWLRKSAENDRQKQISNTFSRILDKLEDLPFHQHKRIHLQSLETAKVVASTLTPNENVRQLQWKITALKYRLTEKYDGLALTESYSQFVELEKEALHWKKKRAFALPHVELSTDEKTLLKEAANYPESLDLLGNDSELKSRFFQWTLQNKMDPQIFFEFPAHVELLSKSLFATRTARFGKKFFTLHNEKGHKDLHMKVDGKFISILDKEKEITFSTGKVKTTVKNIFNLFSKKNLEDIPLEVFGDKGLVNWSSKTLGYSHQTDLGEKVIPVLLKAGTSWWNSVPPLDIFSREEVEKRYAVDCFPTNTWFLVLRATRTHPGLDGLSAHGFFDVLIPDGQGNWSQFPFGKFPHYFPRTIFQALAFVGKTVLANIHYPDPNPFYTHRQQAFAAISLTDEQGHSLMEDLRKEIEKGRNGRAVFQCGYYNCSQFVQGVYNRLFPPKNNNQGEIFAHPVTSMAPYSIGVIYSTLGHLPNLVRNMALRVFHELLFWRRSLTITEATGEKRTFSLHKTPFAQNFTTFYGSRLHSLIENGQLKGQLRMGVF